MVLHKKSHEATIKATLGGRSYTCRLHEPNGAIKVSSKDVPDVPVSFAFISGENFNGFRHEAMVSDIYSSAIPNMRSRFRLLPPAHQVLSYHIKIFLNLCQHEITNHLRDILKIDRLEIDDFSILVHADEIVTEIMYTGSAMRKIFVVLVLLIAAVFILTFARCSCMQLLTLRHRALCLLRNWRLNCTPLYTVHFWGC